MSGRKKKIENYLVMLHLACLWIIFKATDLLR